MTDVSKWTFFQVLAHARSREKGTLSLFQSENCNDWQNTLQTAELRGFRARQSLDSPGPTILRSLPEGHAFKRYVNILLTAKTLCKTCNNLTIIFFL